MCDALHQQSVMRASEDPGGNCALSYISVTVAAAPLAAGLCTAVALCSPNHGYPADHWGVHATGTVEPAMTREKEYHGHR